MHNEKAATQYHSPEFLRSGLTRVLARNPSPFTYWGSGALILGEETLCVIDPGPDAPEQTLALMKAIGARKVSHILITHTHADHCGGARALARATGAPVLAYGAHPVADDHEAAEEGGDHDFQPDITLREGDVIAGQGWTIECLHTPGHISNHLCFAWREERVLMCGDHVMGWASSIVSPPEGHMGDYMRSLRRLLEREDDLYVPTHGAPIEDPKARVRALIAHREAREAKILAALRTRGQACALDLLAEVYADTPRALHPAAARSLLAHLIHLVEQEKARGPRDNPRLRDMFAAR